MSEAGENITRDLASLDDQIRKSGGGGDAGSGLYGLLSMLAGQFLGVPRAPPPAPPPPQAGEQGDEGDVPPSGL